MMAQNQGQGLNWQGPGQEPSHRSSTHFRRVETRMEQSNFLFFYTNPIALNNK
jgi:hypothetical protein